MVSAVGSPQYMPYEAPPAPAGGPPEGLAPTGGNTPARVDALAVNAHSEANGSLSITTKEGDTVTLSAHMDADVTYASLRGRSGSGSFEARSLSLEANSSLSIEVTGDLNEQEMADIQKLVKQFGRELRQFFRGDSTANAADVKGDGASTLSGFAVHFDASQSITVVAATATSEPATPSGIKGQPVSLPATPAVDADGDHDGSTAAGTPMSAASLSSRDISALVNKLLKATRESGLSGEHANHAVTAFFRKAAQLFGGEGERHVLDHVERALKQGIGEQHGADSPAHAAGDTDESAANVPAATAA